jgi:type I restriction enzyme S subunit
MRNWFVSLRIITGKLRADFFQKQSNKRGINFDEGHVLFGKLRPYLKNWLLADFKGIAVGDFWVLNPVKVTSDYLYTLIQSKNFLAVANTSAGSKMPRSDWRLVSNSFFSVPNNSIEQQKIGNIFKELDNLITLHQRARIN